MYEVRQFVIFSVTETEILEILNGPEWTAPMEEV
jgi:hypothetical protein